MSITDELRSVAAKTECANGRCEKLYRGDLERIADRIDAEHESACAEAYGNGVMSVPIALDESAWVELPKDADGEYVRIGDVMRLGSVERDLTVLGFGVPEVGDNEYGVFVLDGDDYTWYNASFLHHHHAPTVEDVLREFGKAWVEWEDGAAMMNPVETFAAKLRLAEGEGA